jgi:hypothetical protein
MKISDKNIRESVHKYLHGECDAFAIAFQGLFGGQLMAAIGFDEDIDDFLNTDPFESL